MISVYVQNPHFNVVYNYKINGVLTNSPVDISYTADPVVYKPWLSCPLCLAGGTLSHCYHNWCGRGGTAKQDWKGRHLVRSTYSKHWMSGCACLHLSTVLPFTCHCISIKCVCVCHVHTYATDITVFEENSSITLSREKFNSWELRQKLFWKKQKRKNWTVWKIFQIKNFNKLVRSALLQSFISPALFKTFLSFPPQQFNTNQCLTCHSQ